MSTKKRTARTFAETELARKYQNEVVSGRGRVYSEFDRLRRRINRELPKKKFVGDISINDEEFQILTEYLQAFFRYLRLLSWDVCTDPLICVVMVQVGIRYYDGGYWSHFAKVLDSQYWSVNRQSVLGKICIETLKEYNKCILEENDRINTILMHGFVSNRYFPSMMDFLYAYYRIELERDLSRNDREMMRELIRSIQDKDNSNRTYKLVQQTSDAVLANPRGSNIRLRWLLRLIDATFWEEEIRINPKNRLSRLFGEWAEKSYELKRNRGNREYKQKVFSSPHIGFDIKKGKFFVLLPSQIVRTNQNVLWRYTFGSLEKQTRVEAYESVLAYKTELCQIPIFSEWVFRRMTFSLEFGETIKRFVIPEETVRFFTKEGASVNISSLKAGEYYAFSKEENAVFSTALVESRMYDNLWFYYFSFEDGDIVKTIDEKAVSIGTKAEEGILSRGLIKNSIEVEARLPVYSKVPSVLIKIPESKLTGTAISINGKKYRLQDTCNVTRVELNDGTGNCSFWFSMKDLGCVLDGKYIVSVDVPNDRTNRSWEFVLLKDFEYSFDEAPYIFASRGTMELQVKEYDSVFAVSDWIEKDSESGYYNFTILPEHRILRFSINDLLIDIAVPQLEYSFDNDVWNTRKHTEIWHSEIPRKIWIRFPTKRLTLEVDNGELGDEECRETFVKREADDVFECDITRFKSWINHKQIRNKVYLNVFGKSISFFDVIARSYVINVLPEADFVKQQINILFDIVGRAEYYVDVLYENQLIAEKIPLVDMKVSIKSSIHSGKYSIEVFESDATDEFGFDDLCYTSIYKGITEIVNPRDLTGKRVEILAIMKDEHDIFKIPLRNHYIISDLKSLDEDGYRYSGKLFDRKKPKAIIDVIFELLDFERLKYALITWIDKEYGDEMEFLYDNNENELVCEEESGLRSSERYRRYECIFTDEFLYEIRVLTTGR